MLLFGRGLDYISAMTKKTLTEKIEAMLVGRSEAELAKEIGISQGCLNKVKNGNSPLHATVLLIEAAYKRVPKRKADRQFRRSRR